MPWKETNAMNERLQFIAEQQRGEDSFAELCRRHGMQRRIGYKWVARFERDGPVALAELSRAPRAHPKRTPAEIVARISKCATITRSGAP